MLLKIITVLLPWKLKRVVLERWFGYSIHPTARIGLSWIFPNKLEMKANTKINHFNVAIHLDKIVINNFSSIGRGNWITGFPKNNTKHFGHQTERQAELFLDEHSSITKNHHLDCTNLIHIGKFSTIAGYNSQFLTHSIDVVENRQDSKPIIIGDYTFVGTNVVILGGATLPSFSVLGAKSLLNRKFSESHCLYGGVPAKEVSKLNQEVKYFSRSSGFVY